MKKPPLFAHKQIFILVICGFLGILCYCLYHAFIPKYTDNKPCPNIDNTVTITRSPYSAWSKKQPKDTKECIGISTGKVINLGRITGTAYVMNYNDDYLLTVNDFDSNQVTLTVTGLSVKQGQSLREAGINLNDCDTHSFTLRKGEIAELNTCSLDSGVTWVIQY